MSLEPDSENASASAKNGNVISLPTNRRQGPVSQTNC